MNIELTDFVSKIGPAIAGFGAVLTAVIAALKYFSRKERMTHVRVAFQNTVQGLSSANESEKLASAVLLRRFFDKKSELYIDTSFEIATINVIAAILRNEKNGHFQKILADGLSYSQSLKDADLQKINAQNCHLDNKNIERLDISYADFFQANLSNAGIKNALAEETVFYQTKLINTTFSNVEFINTNFYEADLDGATFKKCKFKNVDFTGSLNLKNSHFKDCENAPEIIGSPLKPEKVFLSRPSVLTIEQQKYFDKVKDILNKKYIKFEEINKDSYYKTGQLEDIKGHILKSQGVILFDFSDIKISTGIKRNQTVDWQALENYSISSPWIQIEAGMTIMANKPLLILHDNNLQDGVFDKNIESLNLDKLDLDLEKFDDSKMNDTITQWFLKVSK